MNRMRRWASGLLLALGVPGVVSGAARITDLRVWEAPDSTRVVFELSGSTPYKIFALDAPPRVVVDLAAASVAGPLRPVLAPDSPLSGVRVGGPRAGATRIVLDLTHARRFQGFALGPNAPYGHRLVIDLYTPGGPAPAMPAQEPLPTGATPGRPLAPPVVAIGSGSVVPVPPIGVADTTSAATRNGAPDPMVVVAAGERAIAIAEPVRAAPIVPAPPPPPEIAPVTIVIDPGHGGEDPGAKGRGGAREKDVVLTLARALAQRVNAQPGMRAVLTRNGDYFLPLRSRVDFAHRANADLFVSIHADAAPRRDARGSGVYALSERGATNEAARLLAAKENASDRVGGVPTAETRDPVLRSVLLDLSQSATIESGLRLSQYLLGRIGGVNVLHQRSVQQAGFMVLKSPTVPSVLIESAFISNPLEERKLRDPAFHGQFAEALLGGIREYLATDPRLRSAVATAPYTHVVQRGETLSGLALRYGVGSRELVQANPDLDPRVRVGDRVRIPPAGGG